MYRFGEESKVLYTVLDHEYPTHGLGQLCSKKNTAVSPARGFTRSNSARDRRSVTQAAIAAPLSSQISDQESNILGESSLLFWCQKPYQRHFKQKWTQSKSSSPKYCKLWVWKRPKVQSSTFFQLELLSTFLPCHSCWIHRWWPSPAHTVTKSQLWDFQLLAIVELGDSCSGVFSKGQGVIISHVRRENQRDQGKQFLLSEMLIYTSLIQQKSKYRSKGIL